MSEDPDSDGHRFAGVQLHQTAPDHHGPAISLQRSSTERHDKQETMTQPADQPPFVTFTEWDIDPEDVRDITRAFDAAQAEAKKMEGWKGAMLLCSAEDPPRRMGRITIWTSREARRTWQESPAAAAIAGLGKQPGATYWEVVGDSRPA